MHPVNQIGDVKQKLQQTWITTIVRAKYQTKATQGRKGFVLFTVSGTSAHYSREGKARQEEWLSA